MTSDAPPYEQKQKRASARSSAILSRLIDPVLLMLVGVAAVGDGARVIMTKGEVVGGVETGAWIAAIGALLVAGSGVLVTASARHAYDAPPPCDSVLKPPALAFALLVAYVASLGLLGYILATALFMAVYLRVFGGYGVTKVALISIAFAGGSGWLWSFMNMMLPQGPLPWP